MQIIFISVNKIKEIRERLGLTQQQFADKLGIEKSYVGRLEIGERNPGKKTMERIYKAFNIDPAVFFPEFHVKDEEGRTIKHF